MTRIRFSLDAIKPNIQKVRLSIPLERVIRNIEDFLELKEKGNYKLPVVGVSFCKMKDNEDELDEFVKYWQPKVDIVTVQKFVPPTTNKEKYKKYYSSEQYYEEPVNKFHCVQPFKRLVFRNEFMYPCCVSFNKDLNLAQSIQLQSIAHGIQKKTRN